MSSAVEDSCLICCDKHKDSIFIHPFYLMITLKLRSQKILPNGFWDGWKIGTGDPISESILNNNFELCFDTHLLVKGKISQFSTNRCHLQVSHLKYIFLWPFLVLMHLIKVDIVSFWRLDSDQNGSNTFDIVKIDTTIKFPVSNNLPAQFFSF